MMIQQGQCDPCQVCGEQSSGLHCNAVTCEACKKFFLRSIHGEHKKYKCARTKDCVVTRNTRTQCQYCRFSKCIDIGMSIKSTDNQTPTVIDLFKQISCYVCGAASSGIHFGAITCEGCKGFFRRSIKERAPSRYRCQEGGNCDVTVTTRSGCKHCRFQKCLKVGMSVDASRIGRQSNLFKHHIMTMQKNGQIPSTVLHAMSNGSNGFRRTTRKRRANSLGSHDDGPIEQSESCDVLSDGYLSDRELDTLKLLKCAYLECLSKLPEFESTNNILNEASWHGLMKQLGIYAVSCIGYVRRVYGFAALSNNDQIVLLKASIHTLLILSLYRSCKSDCWNYFNCSSAECLKAISHLFPSTTKVHVSPRCTEMLRWIGNIELDDNEFVIILALVVISSDCNMVANFDQINYYQRELTAMLLRYMEARRGERSRDFYMAMFILPQLKHVNLETRDELSNDMKNHHDVICPAYFWKLFIGKDSEVEYKWDVLDVLQSEITAT